MHNENFLIIQQEMEWLDSLLNEAFGLNFDRSGLGSVYQKPVLDLPEIEASDIPNMVYARFILNNQLTFEDRLLLALAMLMHWQPDALERFRRIGSSVRAITDSLIKSASFDYWLPSGLTYVYLYAGQDKAKRYQIVHYLHTQSPLIAHGVVSIGGHLPGEPALSGVLSISPVYWQLLTENHPNLDLLNLETTETHA